MGFPSCKGGVNSRWGIPDGTPQILIAGKSTLATYQRIPDPLSGELCHRRTPIEDSVRLFVKNGMYRFFRSSIGKVDFPNRKRLIKTRRPPKGDEISPEATTP